MQSEEEEAFEVQVLQPFHGWAFERFCDRSGNTFPRLTAAAQRVANAGDDKLNAVTSSDERESSDRAKLEVGVLPSDEWMWAHQWMPDVEYTQCDEEGWCYGSTIARINRRLAEGTTKVKREYYHFVRRRRWIRTRVKKPPVVTRSGGGPSDDDESSSESDSDNESRRVHRPSDIVNPIDAGATGGVEDSPKRFYRVYHDSMLALFHLRAKPRGCANFVRVEFSEDDIQNEGWLGQRGTYSRSWKLRYFLLRLDRSSLVCLRDRASLVQVYEEFIDRHTSVMLEESANPQQFQFLVINRERQLRLNAMDEAMRNEWISAISELIVRSRASFFAGDESEGTMSVRSRTFRRMTTPIYTDNDDDASQSGYFTGVNHSGGGANDGANGGETRRKKRRKAWRPYKLVSATMQSRHDTDRLRRFDYFERFRKQIRKQIEAVNAFVGNNIDILEENLEAAEQLLSSAVAGVPKKDIAQLRLEAKDSLRSFVDRVNDQLALEHANVLTCNVLSRDLYLLAKRLNELILSFAPPVAQATVKKMTVESPSNRRRIPEDWFIEPRDYEKKKSGVSSSSVSQQSDRSVASDRESTRSTVNTSAGKSSEKSSLSRSLLEIKASTGGRRTTAASESGRLSLISNALSGSEPIRIKPYVEMPVSLSEGHFDLPSGVNDFVIKVHDKDLGSLIGFTLCSKAYVAELEAHFGNEVDIAKELAVEERLSFRRPSVTGGDEVDSPPTMNRQVPTDKRAMYLEKMRGGDVQHTDLKFAYETRTSTPHAIRCLTFFAAQFHAVRALTEPGNLQFLNSVAESRRWDTTGGKSGAFFSMVSALWCDCV